MLVSLKAVAPFGTSLCPGGVYREISRCMSDRHAHCVSPCQTPHGSLSWLGWSDGCEVRSTELKRMLRMRPPKHGWCTTSSTKHRKVCVLFPEQQSSQTRNHFHRIGHRLQHVGDCRDCESARTEGPLHEARPLRHHHRIPQQES